MNKYLKKIGFALIATIIISCNKENSNTSNSIKCTNYNIISLLSSNMIASIAIDIHDNKWFGTLGGLVKFDGSNWTPFTTADGLISNKVQCITIDSLNNIWVGTNLGVSKFDGINWSSFTTINGLINNNVYAIAIDAQGNKWFGTDNGVSKFDDKEWKTYNNFNDSALKNVYTIALDQKGNKWFGTRLDGVVKFDGTKWTNYTSDGIFGLVSNYVNKIAVDHSGNKWICTNGGLSEFDDKNNYWKTVDNAVVGYEDLPVYTSIAIDAKDNIWVGTDSYGVKKFAYNNLVTYTYVDGLVDNEIISIAIDKKGNKWIGTPNGITELQDN